MKHYIKPSIKSCSISTTICAASGNACGHGKDHTDNGNHYGEGNGNAWGHYKNGWED